jgi:hypothetical protein
VEPAVERLSRRPRKRLPHPPPARAPGRSANAARRSTPTAGGSSSEKSGRERDTGARINEALNGAKPRGRLKAPDVCASLRQSPAPTRQPSRSDQRRPGNRPNPTPQIPSVTAKFTTLAASPPRRRACGSGRSADHDASLDHARLRVAPPVSSCCGLASPTRSCTPAGKTSVSGCSCRWIEARHGR